MLRKQSLRQKALNSGCMRVDSALRRSKPEMTYFAIFISWKLNSTGWIYLLCSHGFWTRLCAASAFTFYSEVSPCNALFGRQPAMLPDLPVLDHEGPTDSWDHSREQTMRKVFSEAITQATAVAQTNRALRTETTVTGQHYYDEGDLVVYRRPTTTKDDCGGWSGTSPVVKNDPEKGSSHHSNWQSPCSGTIYGDARHSH
eukprot:3525324-Pyramimonas_sp.AAC.1